MKYSLDKSIYKESIIKKILENKWAKMVKKDWNIILEDKKIFLDIIDTYIYEYNETF